MQYPSIIVILFSLLTASPTRADSSDTILLLKSAYQGNISAIQSLLEKGVDVNREKGYTALMIATSQGHDVLVQYLLAAGADVNAQADDGSTALTIAATLGHKAIVRLLLDNGARLDIRTNTMLAAEKFSLKSLVYDGVCVGDERDGYTALMLAVEKGHTEIVKLLLEGDADINDKSIKFGTTLLQIATKQGNTEVVKFLLKEVDINEKDKLGSTALISAVENNQIKIVKTLIDHGAEIDVKDPDGNHVLLLAIQKNYMRIAQLLLNKVANVDIRNLRGETALIISASSGKKEIVGALINKGADVNAKDKNGLTAMYRALLQGHKEVVQLLLENRAEVNIKQDYTPLMIASRKGFRDLVKIMLDKNADVNLKTRNGWTALMMAAKRKHNEIVVLLKKAGAVDLSKQALFNPELFDAIKEDDKDTVYKLLNRGADANLKEERGILTPLILSEILEHKEIIRLLKKYGAKEISLSSLNNEEINYALFVAADVGNIKYVRLLLDKGADGDKIIKLGVSALTIAKMHGHNDIANLLIESGAKNHQPIIKRKKSKRRKIMEWFKGLMK